MSENVDEKDKPLRALVICWADSAVKGVVAIIAAGLLAVAGWGFSDHQRIVALELLTPRIVKLEMQGDGMQVLTTNLAVLQTKMDALTKQNDRIEKLLESR